MILRFSKTECHHFGEEVNVGKDLLLGSLLTQTKMHQSSKILS